MIEMLVGSTGSGKTAYAIGQVSSGALVLRPHRDSSLTPWNFIRLIRRAEEDRSMIVVDGEFLTRAQRRPWIVLSRELGIPVAATVFPSPEPFAESPSLEEVLDQIFIA